MSEQKTLADVLASVSEYLFPQHIGQAPVEVNSRSSSDDTPLHIIAWWGDVDGAKLLIAAGADVNAAGDMGCTPLHGALSQRHEEMVRLLVRSGARIDIKSEFNQTPLEKAMGMGWDVVRWLDTPQD